jgi:hypothetical protein
MQRTICTALILCAFCAFYSSTSLFAQFAGDGSLSPQQQRALDRSNQTFNTFLPAAHGAYFMLPAGIAFGGMSDVFGKDKFYAVSGLPRQWFSLSTMLHYDRVVIETFQTSGILRLDTASEEIRTFGNTLGFGYIVFDTTLSQTTTLKLFPFISIGTMFGDFTPRIRQTRLTANASISALFTIDFFQQTTYRRMVGFGIPIRLDLGYTRHFVGNTQTGNLEDVNDGGGIFLRLAVGIGTRRTKVEEFQDE